MVASIATLTERQLPMRRILLAALAPLCALAAPALADPAEDAVLARQGFFKLLSAEMGPLAAMAKGEAPYDAAAAAAHGANLKALAGYDVGRLFIDGTEQGAAPVKTAALPAIWADPAKFGERFAALQAAIGETAGTLGDGQAAVGAALGKIGGTCKACHDDFRAD
jgi:cytochrome c556